MIMNIGEIISLQYKVCSERVVFFASQQLIILVAPLSRPTYNHNSTVPTSLIPSRSVSSPAPHHTVPHSPVQLPADKLNGGGKYVPLISCWIASLSVLRGVVGWG